MLRTKLFDIITKGRRSQLSVSHICSFTMSRNTSGAVVWLLAIISTQVVSKCDGFVQPFLSSPFLQATAASIPTKSGASLQSKHASRLFSTAQEVEASASSSDSKRKETQILADGDDFIKPNLDTRGYRSILLPNNLQALLVSDPETDVEAGAVHIKAGHFDDPETRAGLAHL